MENKQADDVVFAQLTRLYCVQTHHIHLLIPLQAESTAELSLNVLSKRRKGESNVNTMLFISNQLNQGQIFHSYCSLILNFLDECKRKSNFEYISSLTKEKKRRKTKRKEKKNWRLALRNKKAVSLFDRKFKVACHVHKIIHHWLFRNIKVVGN